MNEKTLQWFGFAASAVGAAATMFASWVASKELKLDVQKEVEKQLAEAIKNLNK